MVVNIIPHEPRGRGQRGESKHVEHGLLDFRSAGLIEPIVQAPTRMRILHDR